MSKKNIKKDAIKELQKIEWTGNIREFRNVLERLIILCKDDITGKDVIASHSPVSGMWKMFTNRKRQFRRESRLPADALYGIHSVRARENFPSDTPFPRNGTGRLAYKAGLL